MVSNRCKLAVKEELKNLDCILLLLMGEVDVMENINIAQKNFSRSSECWF
jgi:hypothetical protein